jgi:excisionase family DNA binding protein
MKPENGRIMTVRELADLFRVHPTTIYRQLKNGQLPAFKVGSEWRFDIESIDRWRFAQDSSAGTPDLIARPPKRPS